MKGQYTRKTGRRIVSMTAMRLLITLMASQPNQPEELNVFISNRESDCGECDENLGSRACGSRWVERKARCVWPLTNLVAYH
jgi:hypothetical protein